MLSAMLFIDAGKEIRGERVHSKAADSNLIFGMHMYLMELHILSGERSRSRSSFKVKYMGQNCACKVSSAILKLAIFLFEMHVYLKELHILSVEGSRSRSSYEVNIIYGDIVFLKHILFYF
ncbi:hypothetical protein DPMN_114556 [Dreissena polymorpha]|uniref:Uncharacterized protein n=1 Tax=Dreissena polymorpha TaxID=45954 RepID=A0A9D4KKD9_DREPO|nr:hypothetical protein DPMN_114556 [Dreissena polymorpha]